ncbi:MAG: hypothetical protein HUU19_11820 [Phycisphaerales bacterium]|nr:hypothetical protein [Phycisphaerales bacterium]
MSELISHFKLTTFPIAALVIFLIVFGAVCWRVFRPAQSAEMNRNGHIPLSDD